jgi:hypothetical protein
MFSENDEIVAERVLNVFREFISPAYGKPDSKQLILGGMQDYEFGLSSLETFPRRILAMLVPGQLIEEIVDISSLETRVRILVKDWYIQKTARLADQIQSDSICFADDSR